MGVWFRQQKQKTAAKKVKMEAASPMDNRVRALNVQSNAAIIAEEEEYDKTQQSQPIVTTSSDQNADNPNDFVESSCCIEY